MTGFFQPKKSIDFLDKNNPIRVFLKRKGGKNHETSYPVSNANYGSYDHHRLCGADRGSSQER